MYYEKLNLFSKTRFNLAEEDRVTNGLLILFQHSGIQLMRSFLENINIQFSEKDKIFIYDHVLYSTTSIVDGEIIIPKKSPNCY